MSIGAASLTNSRAALYNEHIFGSTMDDQVQKAFEDWKSDLLSQHIKYVPASIQMNREPPTSPSFTARAQYELPDGGRFHLIISGETSPKASSTLTGMIEDGLGLPDGFLMDINNFLFGDLSETPKAKSPTLLIEAVLKHASSLYEKLTGDAGRPPPAVDAIEPVQLYNVRNREFSNKRKRSSFHYNEPHFGENRVATTTLMKQLSILTSLDTQKDGFVAEPTDDNLYIWTVRLYFQEKDSCQLANDLARLKEQDHVKLEFRFPSEYPNVPPIVRVVSPFIVGGHVAPHGGLCMELLTTSGWAPVNSLDVVCIQIRTMLLHANARIDFHRLPSVRNYTFEGALADMRNIVKIHRWDTADPRNSRRKVLKS